MKHLFVLVTLILLECTLAIPTKVWLRGVESIVVKSGSMTTARRTTPIPQLSCSGLYCENGPRSVRCKNVGWDGIDVTWRCEGEMAPGMQFDQVDVSCEGYDFADDPYILADSCAVRYSLRKVAAVTTKSIPPSPPPVKSSWKIGEIVASIVSTLGIILVVIVIFVCLCCGINGTRPRQHFPTTPPTSGFSVRPFMQVETPSVAYAPTRRRDVQEDESALRRRLFPSEKPTTSVAYSGTTRREEPPKRIEEKPMEETNTSTAYSGTSRREEEKDASNNPTTSTGYSKTKRR